MSYRVPRDDTSRKVIDRAIGILVGLRGCSPDDAFAELVRVVKAFNAWGELIRRTKSASLAAAP